MAAHVIVRKDCYFDSIVLMRISGELKASAGVEDAVVAMGTPHNRALVSASGYASPELEGATANDLVIAVKSASLGVAEIAALVDAALGARKQAAPAASSARPTSLRGALAALPDVDMVVISIPGEHAAREARRALLLGRHVMLFSDNVSLEDEVSLKQLARERGLLLMGPDCGTAIINGKPLAFANVVRRGTIGIVGAAGTGIQEVSSCIHRLGGGVSQAIGTGGRDLTEAVGGATMLMGLEALAADRETKVIVVVSKPPAAAVAEKVVAAVRATKKPAVVHFVGADDRPKVGKVVFAPSLAEAAHEACALAGVHVPPASRKPSPKLVASLAGQLGEGTTLRGLFCGGTTGAEALSLLGRAGLEVRSNLHKKGPLVVDGLAPVRGHGLLDLGDDVFTRGRPHPMIEPELRNERLMTELDDKRVGLLLFDVVLGHGSHADPAGVLVRGLVAARKKRRRLVAIASLTGTEADPQPYGEQRKKLEDAGVVVMDDNRQASALCAAVLAKVG